MFQYAYDVPEGKKIRLIIHTDCKNEADDQYAVAHQLMVPKFDVVGIIAGHFAKSGERRYPGHGTAKASYDEIMKILDLMHITEEYRDKVYMGAAVGLPDEKTPVDSEGARFIVEEAMKDDPRPLFIGMQGAITDLAAAILLEPRICSRMTAIWIGGGTYPEGGNEFNLFQDINGANVVFSSSMPLWQVNKDVYKQMSVTLAELQLKVRPYGAIGRYLFDQMADFSRMVPEGIWPHGETWGLGDQGVIGCLLEEVEKTEIYDEVEAPNFDPETMAYVYGRSNRKIRVYRQLDSRLVLEDFFARLQLNFPKQDS
ncbi:MAG: nucleoside hydrolase [Lachnospiraceae bacterium]|nr:nucleoside hydrolase [Lachnospiraceae bacterium]